MRKRCALVYAVWLMLHGGVQAQERPVAVSTLTTTNTGASSICVGCAVGTTTPAGTILTFLIQSNDAITTGTASNAGGLIVKGAAGSVRGVFFRTASTNRWILSATNTAEAGANAGSNFNLDSYTDAGALIGTALAITRSTMSVTLGENLTVAGDIVARRSGATHWAISGGGGLITSVAYDNGANSGNYIVVERNNNGSTPAAGSIELMRRTGVAGVLWVDASADVRVGTTLPTNATDGGGTVVGTQTSTRASKNILGGFTDNAGALRTLLRTPVYRFTYKSGAFNGTEFVGITTDDSPTFGMDLGRSFNPVTAFGYTVAAFKAQAAELDALRARVAALERRR